MNKENTSMQSKEQGQSGEQQAKPEARPSAAQRAKQRAKPFFQNVHILRLLVPASAKHSNKTYEMNAYIHVHNHMWFMYICLTSFFLFIAITVAVLVSVAVARYTRYIASKKNNRTTCKRRPLQGSHSQTHLQDA